MVNLERIAKTGKEVLKRGTRAAALAITGATMMYSLSACGDDGGNPGTPGNPNPGNGGGNNSTPYMTIVPNWDDHLNENWGATICAADDDSGDYPAFIDTDVNGGNPQTHSNSGNENPYCVDVSGPIQSGTNAVNTYTEDLEGSADSDNYFWTPATEAEAETAIDNYLNLKGWVENDDYEKNTIIDTGAGAPPACQSQIVNVDYILNSVPPENPYGKAVIRIIDPLGDLSAALDDKAILDCAGAPNRFWYSLPENEIISRLSQYEANGWE